MFASCSTDRRLHSIYDKEVDAVWVSANPNAHSFYTKSVDITVTFVGIRDSNFVFEAICSSKKHDSTAVTFDRVVLRVKGCRSQFVLTIVGHSEQKTFVMLDQKPMRLELRFKTLDDRNLNCLLSGGDVILTGIDMLKNGRRYDYGEIPFEPSNLW